MEEEEKSLQRERKAGRRRERVAVAAWWPVERKAGRRRERVAVAAWWPVGEEFKQPLVVETVMKRRW
jgi:hypothetical protein